jgi:hypothetical protein
VTAADVGILFRGRLVRGILAGRKTATRRLIDSAAGAFWDHGGWAPIVEGGRIVRWDGGGDLVATHGAPLPRCPYGGPGGRLWVRETHRAVEREADGMDGVLYRADNTFRPIEPTAAAAELWQAIQPSSRRPPPRNAVATPGYRPRLSSWRPAIFMPRWACRIELEVTGVRAERLQAMTTADAYAEGLVAGDRDLHGPDMARWPVEAQAEDEAPGGTWANAVDVFAGLWDSINEARAPWASNPWVWVIEFRRIP